MPRIELLMCLLAGSAGGLCGTLWGAIVSTRLLDAVHDGNRPGNWQESATRFLQGSLLYVFGGAVLGFLFWLSWGLVALVEVPWPLLGALFGALCWCGASLPALGMLDLRGRGPRRLVAAVAVEWLVACLAAGLLCALAWHRAN